MPSDPACVFCQIIAGEAEASFIYRDENLVAFMDIRPISPGHVLVVPTHHVASLSGLDDEIGGLMIAAARRIARALRQSELRCEGINLFMADGTAAGQTVFHVHLHVIPRFPEDGLGFRFPPGYARGVTREALDRQAGMIRARLESQTDGE